MNPPKRSAAAIALALFVLFSAWITERAKRLDRLDTGGNTSHLVGGRAPDFTLTALDGRPVRLSDYREKKMVVVSFWASWCGPCRMEMPTLQSFYRKNSDKVEVLALSIDQDPAAARRYAEENKLPFAVLLDNEERTARAYGVNGIPTLFIVDRTGQIKASYEGMNPALDAVLTTAIGEPFGTAGRNGR